MSSALLLLLTVIPRLPDCTPHTLLHTDACVGHSTRQVVDALSEHFLHFAAEPRQMPVVWHQCLLIFVQRYKHQLTTASRDALRGLTEVQHHYLVSAEVVRELDQAAPRDARGGFDNGAAALGVVRAGAKVAPSSVPERRVGQHVTEDLFNMPAVPVMEED